jgi:hypothetical protein
LGKQLGVQGVHLSHGRRSHSESQIKFKYTKRRLYDSFQNYVPPISSQLARVHLVVPTLPDLVPKGPKRSIRPDSTESAARIHAVDDVRVGVEHDVLDSWSDRASMPLCPSTNHLIRLGIGSVARPARGVDGLQVRI